MKYYSNLTYPLCLRLLSLGLNEINFIRFTLLTSRLQFGLTHFMCFNQLIVFYYDFGETKTGILK